MLRLVDAGIIHDNHRVTSRERIHIVKKAINEFIKKDCSVRPTQNVEMKDTVK